MSDRIIAEPERLQELTNIYGNQFKNELDRLLDYCNKKGLRGMKERHFFLQGIKKDITLIDTEYQEPRKITRKEATKKALEIAREKEEKAEPPKEILKVLQNPNLFNEITEKELDKKIVGEVETRKVIFLCGAGGRLVKNCQTASFNLLVNDDAGVGKDLVVRNTLKLLPKEVYIHKTRFSEKVFSYWHNAKAEPDWSWDGKVFYSEDISENVLNSEVFKVMCSSGSSSAIVDKQKAVEIEVIGKPVMITTTASATPNPELTRRFVILNLDSSEKQTELIMQRHSEYKMKGLMPEYNPIYAEAMRYLKRVDIKIPFADLIDKHFPKNVIMRTNYPRFLDFICASTSFHQYQRQKEGGFFLAEGQDYDIARNCFIKLSSNKYMIPLTINQKKILAIFEKEPNLKLSASQTLPFMKGAINTIVSMQNNLRNLVKYGLLKDDVGRDSYGRDMEIFSISTSYNPNETFNLPTFKEICSFSKVSKVSEVSEVSKVSEVSFEEKEKDTLDTSLTSVTFDTNNSTQIHKICSKCGSPDAFIVISNELFCKRCAYEH